MLCPRSPSPARASASRVGCLSVPHKDRPHHPPPAFAQSLLTASALETLPAAPHGSPHLTCRCRTLSSGHTHYFSTEDPLPRPPSVAPILSACLSPCVLPAGHCRQPPSSVPRWELTVQNGPLCAHSAIKNSPPIICHNSTNPASLCPIISPLEDTPIVNAPHGCPPSPPFYLPSAHRAWALEMLPSPCCPLWLPDPPATCTHLISAA